VAAMRRAKRGDEIGPAPYPESIHGKGLLESGLVVTAMCTDCHTPHHVLPKDDPNSSIHAENISETCAKCHNGIFEKFIKSIHSPEVSESTDSLPNCASCHQSHALVRTDSEGFKQKIIGQCGGCHEDLTKTYFETYHGKVFQLGGLSAAECHDCHGAHDILPPVNPASHLSRENIVGTCGKCHEGSHRQFAGYLTHATHHDKEKYPALFYTFWFMTFLLVGTLVVATTHTLLWLPRSIVTMRQKKLAQETMRKKIVYRRFTKEQSIQHAIMVVSFLGLAVTGMTLKFSYLPWAKWLSEALGGFESAGYIHRVCAVLTGVYFIWHLVNLVQKKMRKRVSWKAFLLNKESMLPNWNDLREIGQSIKWFIGMGPRPQYGRWTYWEKFDYFAVFWGVAIIGSTGLVLWFPEIFTLVLPGWFVNVATIIHSDEALLATAFIFTVHFFNTHFRPDKFPMDITIFTGRESLEELKHERPREYERLKSEGKLARRLEDPLPLGTVRLMKIFGATALVIGLILIGLIIYAEVFGYR
jgi:cytochrome b subunit of formate dehydrogenase